VNCEIALPTKSPAPMVPPKAMPLIAAMSSISPKLHTKHDPFDWKASSAFTPKSVMCATMLTA